MSCESVGREVFERFDNFYRTYKPDNGRCKVTTPEGTLLVQKSSTTLFINTIEPNGHRVDLNSIEIDEEGTIKLGTSYHEVTTSFHYPMGRGRIAGEIVSLADLIVEHMPTLLPDPIIARDIPILVFGHQLSPELIEAK